MALVTIQRSPSPSVDPDVVHNDSSEDFTDGKPQMRKSLSQSYFTVKGAALILPHTEFTKKSAKKTHGGEIQNHLQAMLHLLRPEDTIKIAIRLEDTNQYQRYMALVSTRGRQDTEEAVILGIDCNNTEASIGLVLPLWMGVRIKLGGDGGFSLCTDEQSYLFKPVSVQAMWSAIQSLVKVQHIADDMKYIPEGLTHTWIGYYKALIDRRDSARISQWTVVGVEVFAPSSLSIKSNDNEDERIKLNISQTLKEVMMTVDLDEATSIMLRKAVEEKMGMSLTEFKSYFDEEVMRILGQMDEPSEILEFLYLGSEWNASNLDELLDKGIGYILNVTKEIDNFFEDRFHYYNVRVYDEDGSDLLKHWDKTYKFISKARSQKSKVLVHCKMGISRSASTVMAFIMKDRRWSVEEAFKFVKEHRNCVHPNAGFMEQLYMYEAILTASNKRDIFRSRSDQNLLDEDSKEETEPSQGSFLGDSLFHMMSHSDWLSASGGVALEEEWIGSLQKDQGHDSDLLQMETDFETASRSADSMEEALPDMPSPSSDVTEADVFTNNGFMAPLATVPLVSARLSPGRSSLDTEMTTTEKPDANRESEKEVSSSEGTSFSKQPASGCTLSSRIKPDSSWIKLEEFSSTEQVNSESQLPYTESVPSDETLSNLQPNSNAQFNTATKINKALISQDEMLHPFVDISEDTKVNPAATTVPDSLLYFGSSDLEKSTSATDNTLAGNTIPHAQFYIGNIQDPLNITPTVPSIVLNSPSAIPEQSSSFSSFLSLGSSERSSSSLTLTQNDQTVSQNLQDMSVTQESLEQVPQHICSEHHSKVAETVENIDNGVLNNYEGAKKNEGVKSDCSDNLESIVLQGNQLNTFQVRQTQDIKMTGPSFCDDFQNNKSMKTDINEINVIQGESLGVCSDQISEHHPATVFSHSHSSMEECTQEGGDSALMSLYERENIPLTPGTVLRTKHEIEERQKLIVGEDDPNIFSSAHPVLRTSSLKQDGNTHRSRYTLSRRLSGPVLTPLTGKSLDELPAPEVRWLRQTDIKISKYPSSSQLEETVRDCRNEPGEDKVLPQSPESPIPGAKPLTRTQVPLLEHIQSNLQTVEGNPADGRDPEVSSPRPQHRAMGNFDSETLALIREIGSALLMSPTPQKQDDDEEEPCNNMVKYLVRKIEKQAKISTPPRNVVLADSGRRKFTSHENDESSKFLSAGENVHPGIISSVSMFVPTLAVPRKPLDFQHISASEEKKTLSSQSDLSHKSYAYTSTDHSSSTSEDLNIKCQQQVSDMEPVKVHYITPTYLPVNKAEPLKMLGKTAESESVPSPGSQNYSYGHEPSEPSIVRHLVGRFETRSPESENSSSEFGHDNMSKCKDVYDVSSFTLSSDQKSLKEDDNIPPIWSLEDSSNQTSASANQFFPRQIDSHEPLHFSTSLDSTTSSLGSLPPQLLTLSPNLSTLNRKYTFTDTPQNKPGVAKKHPFTFGMDVDSQQPSCVAEASGLKVRASSCSEEPKQFSSVKSWKPNSPKQVHYSVSHSEHEPLSSDIHQRRETRLNHSDPTDDDVSMRQVSSEGRKIRRLHGKSHPLTKLSQQGLGRGPFYSSM